MGKQEESWKEGAEFEIVLDFTARDKRKVVDVRWLTDPVDVPSMKRSFLNFFGLCPITGQFFVNPVVLHGSVFELAAAWKWVASTGRHPLWRGIQCRLEDISPARDVEDCIKLR
eukprot:g19103.t1